MSGKMTADEIREGLSQFYGGDTIYRHPMFRNMLYSEGVRFIAEEAGAYWLIDGICGHQVDPKVAKEEFQVWHLTVHPDWTADLVCTDGNDGAVTHQNIKLTDFPLPNITIWLENRTLVLPAER